MPSNAEYALMAGRAYQSTRDEINRFPVPEGWNEPIDKRKVLPSGFEAGYFIRGNEIVISFAGTGPEILNPDWLANFGLTLGSGATQLDEAAAYYMEVRAAYPNAAITFTGHSLGGGLAALLSVFFNETAVTFDPAPFRASANNDVRNGLVTYLMGLGYSGEDQAIQALQSFHSSLPANNAGPSEELGIRGESNVSILRVVGEAIDDSILLAPWNPIGVEGPPLTHGGTGVSGVDLHSQALLTAFVQSTAFRAMTSRLPELLGMVFDSNLFANPTDTGTKNLLEHLIRHQVGLRDPATGAVTLAADAMLDRFTSDLDKLVVARGGTGGYLDLVKALVAFAMEKYYAESPADSQQQRQLFLTVTGGLQFDTRDIAADITGAKGYAQYFANYLDTDSLFSSEERALIGQRIADLRDWSVAVGNSGMTATDTLNRGAFMLGSGGIDFLTGGTAADLLIGGAGNDTLTGGAGADVLMGGADDDILHGDDGEGGDILDGGAGFDTYYADLDDTIRDSDGKGIVYLNGKQLSFAIKKKGETVWEDSAGNTYALNGGRLEIDDPLVIEGFDNGELGIYLDEEEDPNDPPKPPAYNPNNAIALASSPLALDLNGNGVIDDIGLAGSSVYFDLTNDGIAEKTGWLAPGDGLVGMDMNGNGVIDNRDELFGTDPLHTAFDRMRELIDANGDGIIDAFDPLFGALRVWQDANSDGISQASELKTLEELGITSLDAIAAPAAQATANGNRIIATAGFTINGERRSAVDIEFAYDVALTNANPNRPLDLPPTLDPELFDLPWLRGYGMVKSLPIAYQENTGLRQAAAELMGQGWQGIHANFDSFMAKWTGLEAAHQAKNVTRSNLTVEDKIWMLETLTGQNVQKSIIEAANFGAVAPGVGWRWNTAYIDSAWTSFVQREALSFSVQAATKDWLKGVSYSLNRDCFVTMDAGQAAASLRDRFNTVTESTEAAFAATVALRLMRDGVALDVAAIRAGLMDSPFKVLFETTLDLAMTNRIETVAMGGGGNETLYGGAGNDFLMGGTGNDYLQGGAGNDTYIFGNGYGQDVIKEDDWTTGNVDTVIAAGIAPADVTVTRDHYNLYLSLNGGADKLTLQYWFLGDAYKIEHVVFADNTVWNSAELLNRIVIAPATEDNDALYGTEAGNVIDGLGGNDQIYGFGSNDTLKGGSGNDTLDGGVGNDTLDGGTGNDYLLGDAGNDTYIFGNGYGQDVISEYGGAAGDIDTVQMAAGITPADVTVTRDQYNLYLSLNGGADKLTLEYWFLGDDYKIERVTFVDGTTWDAAELRRQVSVTPGTAGNDIIFGSDAADILDGGTGDDWLDGATGNDVYVLNPGFGRDIIADTGSAADTLDTIRFGAGIAPADVVLTRDSSNLYLAINGTLDRVTLQQWFQSDAQQIERIEFSDGTVWGITELAATPLDGTNNADQMWGSPTSDRINGFGGADEITAGMGDDILDGGTGNDWLDGGAGNDTYLFSPGFGQDTIVDRDTAPGQTDTIRFAAGILSTDILLERDASHLYLKHTNSTDVITILDFFSDPLSRIERVEFADGTIWDAVHLASVKYIGTYGDDYLYGSDTGDRIDGLGGNDYLSGGTGADTLDGGAGNDYLSGDDGADTYLFARGFGQDTIYEYDAGSGGNDIVRFAADIQTSDIELSRNESDLFLKVLGTGDRITVSGFYADPLQRIERVEFADGTVWDEAALASAKYLGTEGSDFITGTDAAERFETGAGDDYVTAMGGNDVVYGGAGNDALSGDAGNDTLYGEDGNDSLNGGAGADTLDGGAGNDYLSGDDGADTYLFARGFGQDTIYEYDEGSGGNDIVRFAADILSAEVELSRNESDLFIKVLGTDDRITVSGYYSDTAQRIERVEFADGTVWDEAMLASAKYVGTDGSDFITGTDAAERFETGAGDDYVYAMGGNDVIYGGAGNDGLSGDAGNDALYGEDGNDSLSGGAGADTLDGGVGNDYLSGDDGADTYLFARGFGQDTIYEYDEGSGGNDIVRFAADIQASEIELSRNESDLFLKVLGTEDRITVSGFYADTAQRIERVEFADGTVWTSSTLLAAKFVGTEGADFITGTTGNDRMEGRGGDDYLYGDAGADTLDGGSGNDQLDGGAGNDTYLFARGYGQDTIYETSGTDTVRFAAGITAADVFVWRDDINYYFDLVGTNDRLTVDNWYSGSTYRIENAEFADGTVWNSSVLNSKTTTASEYADFYWGTASANTYDGLAGDDRIFGFGGNDTLRGGDGNDFIDGGIGNDIMIGGTGDDTYVVDSATDTVTELAGEGTDLVQTTVTYTLAANVENLTLLDAGGAINGTGNELDNALTGNLYDNVLSGGAGNDYLESNAGNDTLDGGTGADIMIGGTGSDTYVVDDAGDVVIELAGQGTDTVQSSIGYVLGSNLEKLTLTGTAAIDGTGNELNNTLTGNSAANTLIGGAGDDSLNGGAGADTLIGGIGDDIYTVDNAGDVVVELEGEGNDTVRSSIDWTLGATLENLTLTGSANRVGTGNALDNVLTGNSGNNTLYGLAGNDWLDGGAGADTLIGGTGDDTYVVDNAADVVTENAGEGTDTVQASVTHTLAANVENLILTGSTAINGTGNTLDNVITGNSANNTLNGGAGADTLVGGLGDDIYVADALDTLVENSGEGTDTVQAGISYTLGANIEKLTLTGSAAINGTGNALDNTLTGNSAANVLAGGLGNDTYVIGATDTVAENAGEGTDTVQASFSHTLAANVESLTLTGSSAINATGNELDNTLTGNSGANVLTGLAGNDWLDGKAGVDTMLGGSGNDTYVVDNAGDVVTELANEGVDTVRSSLTYTLAANVENLLLTGSTAINGTGNALDNVLTGNTGANMLTGGAGNDTLNGGTGADTMLGGAGDDSYTVDNTGDVVTENATEGTDSVTSSIAYALGATLENLTLSGSSAIAGTGNAAANILVGNTGANTLWGREGDDTLRGNAGADTLNGELGDDYLDGGSGNDTLAGGVGNDNYWLARGYGNDTIQENDATAGNADQARFDTGIAADQLWFRHVGNNLEVSIIGTADKFTLQNWYSGSAYHVEQFRTTDNRLLLDSQVENLVQAMAAFSPPASGQTTLPQNYQDALSPVIAANWQ